VLRLCAAFIAAPIFEVSLLITLVLLLGRRGAREFLSEVPLWTHAAYMGVAAAIGFAFGFRGLIWLLGHLFVTHRGNERNLFVTVAAWSLYAAVLCAAYVAWRR
jgi:hypothetical protein